MIDRFLLSDDINRQIDEFNLKKELDKLKGTTDE